MMKIIFYQKDGGKELVKDFIKKLEKKDKAKVLEVLKNIEDKGLDSNRAVFRQIKDVLWEIKIKTSGGGYRIFYVIIESKKMVLLHMYKKESQKAPKKEIEVATKRMNDILSK